MENLNLQDRPPPGGQDPAAEQHLHMRPPPAIPQLPPQMFTTAAQLLELTDKKLIAVLRDGKKFIGVLRSFDQFGNLALQNTVERIYGGQLFADIDRGFFIVRGENIMMLGEIDLDKEDDIPVPFKRGNIDEVLELYKRDLQDKKAKDKVKLKKLESLGFIDAENATESLI